MRAGEGKAEEIPKHCTVNIDYAGTVWGSLGQLSNTTVVCSVVSLGFTLKIDFVVITMCHHTLV